MKTHGRIKNCIAEFNPLPAMAVFSSLYFNGKWQSPFDKSKTQIDPVYREGRKPVGQ
ncbi:MAG: serpin family protein [Bacillota bacterium]